VAYERELENMCRVLIWKETHERPSGRRETILKLFLKNLRSCFKKILNWLRDLDFVAEDKRYVACCCEEGDELSGP
jgi:hypothetical protein